MRELQDLGLMHLADPKPGDVLRASRLSPRQERERRQLTRVLDDLDAIDGAARPRPAGGDTAPNVGDFARWARLARRVRRAYERLEIGRAALTEERALILKYRDFFAAFESLMSAERGWPNARAYHVILRPEDTESAPALRARLADVIGEEFELFTHRLSSGETAVLLLVTAPAASQVEQLLGRAGVHELPVPRSYEADTLAEAVPKMLTRLTQIPRELREIDQERQRLDAQHQHELGTARAAVHDRLLELDAMSQVGATRHAFVIEGWMPKATVPQLGRRLNERFGEEVVVEEVQVEEWAGESVPVVLSNPRLFRPFEVITKTLPLPRYGSMDPTPFVAVFFPMFFGLMLGDVGYGALLAAIAGVLHWKSQPESVLRSVSEVAGACAAFAIVFGVLYGELFGDLGRRLFDMPVLAFDRSEAILPFLGLAVALGLVHVLLGLILGVFSALRGDRRASLGKGVAAGMIVFVAMALLAALNVLPGAFFTPAIVALLLAFPVLIVLEGLVAPIELLSTLGNVLSYARIMALGTASVMMAVIANRMVGALGSALVGVLFALLFHLVNFAIGVFSPTIHALRLHYVEFFGKFYSPGGAQYRPYGHWRPPN